MSRLHIIGFGGRGVHVGPAVGIAVWNLVDTLDGDDPSIDAVSHAGLTSVYLIEEEMAFRKFNLDGTLHFGRVF